MTDGIVTESSQSVVPVTTKKAEKKRAWKERAKARKESMKRNKPKMTKEERRAKYTQKAKDLRQKQAGVRRNKKLVCFRCRQVGHLASDCQEMPNTTDDDRCRVVPTSGTKLSTKICYKCGSTEHRLQVCPKLTKIERKSKLNYSLMDLPFATCYICNETGHLASQCGQNKNGIYVNGGCCKECGGVDHLYTNCPKLKKSNPDEGDESDVLIDDYLEADEKNGEEISPSEPKIVAQKKRRVVNF